jgi:excisionase family DNA binding protein
MSFGSPNGHSAEEDLRGYACEFDSRASIERKIPADGQLGDAMDERPGRQAAQLLDIHHKTLQKLARRGEIHGSHVGKLWRFRASDLNAWLERQERAS